MTELPGSVLVEGFMHEEVEICRAKWTLNIPVDEDKLLKNSFNKIIARIIK